MAKKAAKKKALGIVRSVLVEQNVNSCWYWKLRAGNGEILAHSEAYTSSQWAWDAATQIAKQLKVRIEIRSLSE